MTQPNGGGSLTGVDDATLADLKEKIAAIEAQRVSNHPGQVDLLPTERERPPHYVEPDPVEDGDVEHDFDVAWAERAKKAPLVKILGKKYRLPPSLPAKLVLFAAKAKREGRDLETVVGQDELVDLMNSLLGKENVQIILDDGLDTDQLGDVLKYCMERYKDKAEKDQAAAKQSGGPNPLVRPSGLIVPNAPGIS